MFCMCGGKRSLGAFEPCAGELLSPGIRSRCWFRLETLELIAAERLRSTAVSRRPRTDRNRGPQRGPTGANLDFLVCALNRDGEAQHGTREETETVKWTSELLVGVGRSGRTPACQAMRPRLSS